MANRGDFNSKLPRQIKRLLSLGTGATQDAHTSGEIRRIWIEAHAKHKFTHNRMLKSRGPGGGDSDE